MQMIRHRHHHRLDRPQDGCELPGDLHAFSCYPRVVGKKSETLFQPLVVVLGLIEAELCRCEAEIINNILFGLDAEAIAHAAQSGAVFLRTSLPSSAMDRVPGPLSRPSLTRSCIGAVFA